MKTKNKLIHLLVGPVLFFASIFFLPASVFLSLQARAAVGSLLWMAYSWITGPVDYAVTALLPIGINAVVQIAPMEGIISQYASETILLLLGASILTASWEKTGLDKRISTIFLRWVGISLTTQVIFWFLLSAALSALLPNAVVAATLVPIAVSMLKHAGQEDVKNSPSASLILLTIVWGAGLGGLATPLGGAMNLVVVQYLEKVTGQEFMYVDWVVRFAPIMLVLVVSNLAFLMLIKPKDSDLPGSKEYFKELQKKLGKMSAEEVISLALFALASLLAFSRQLYAEWLPGLKPAYVFIICGILSFVPGVVKGQPMLNWSEAQRKVEWGLIYMFAGGLAIGELITGSGVDAILGSLLQNSGVSGTFPLVLIIIALTLILSDISSNTATAAITLPIVVSLTTALNLNPIPYIYAATVGINISYSLPTSIRAIPVGYGLEPKYMFKRGVVLSFFVILIMSIMCWLLVEYWPAFSIA